MALDETQIKPGSADDRPIEQSLAPLKTAAEVAYRRAPTLMAGASAGGQGQVRVWAPSRKLLWSFVVMWGAVSVLLLLLPLIEPGDAKWAIAFCYFVFWTITTLFTSVSALRRPGYITTDDAGIGITTRKGSLPLQWTEIKAIRSAIGPNEIILLAPDKVELNAQGKIVLSLRGYPEDLRKELVALIAERAGLEASGSPPPHELFVRPGYTTFNNWCTPVAQLKAGSETAGESLAPER